MRIAKATRRGGGCYLVLGVGAIMWIIFIRLFLPFEAIHYVFEQFLFVAGSASEWFLTAWVIWAIGIPLNLWKMGSTTNPPEVHAKAPTIPISGFGTSLMAGIFEELVFRWILLYAALGLLWVINLGAFAFTGIELVRLAIQPLTDLLVFLLMNGVDGRLVNPPELWALGFAIFLSVLKFQQGHLYQGKTGFLFSGLAGLVFFRVMFVHGLLAAMVVHFSFDMMVFIMLLIDVWIEKLLGTKQPYSKLYDWYRTLPKSGSNSTP